MGKSLDVVMPDGSIYPVGTLLTAGDRNVKLLKSELSGADVLSAGLTLAPAMMSGVQMCGANSPHCTDGCLRFTGHNPIPSVMRAQIAKARALVQDPIWFAEKLATEIDTLRTKARRQRKLLAIRPNMMSDQKWELLIPELFTTFADVQFYDYTKFPGRVTPSNYHLTFSRSEINERVALREYARGLNVAVVFADKNLPETWQGIPVFSGDQNDLRFLDPRGIVGLYYKGPRARMHAGFVVSTATRTVAA